MFAFDPRHRPSRLLLFPRLLPLRGLEVANAVWHSYASAVRAGPHRSTRLPDSLRRSSGGAVSLPDPRADYNPTAGDDRSLPAVRPRAGRDATAGCPGRRAALPAGAGLSAGPRLPAGANLPTSGGLRTLPLHVSLSMSISLPNIQPVRFVRRMRRMRRIRFAGWHARVDSTGTDRDDAGANPCSHSFNRRAGASAVTTPIAR
jgi:hypothetical protein